MEDRASEYETKESFRKRLNERRKAQGLTIDNLSKILSVDIERVKKWCYKGQLPEALLLIKLAVALDCDVDYLVGLKEEPRRAYVKVAEVTGLSYEAAEFLGTMAKYKDFVIYLETVSDLLIQMKTDEASSLLLGLSNYIHTDYLPDRTEDESLFTAYQKADMLSLYGRLEAFANKCRDNKREAIT